MNQRKTSWTIRFYDPEVKAIVSVERPTRSAARRVYDAVGEPKALLFHGKPEESGLKRCSAGVRSDGVIEGYVLVMDGRETWRSL